MTVNSKDEADRETPVSNVIDEEELSAVDLVLGLGDPQKVGRFSYLLDGDRWQWSDAVARMHGYAPGTVEPTTDLLLQHKHPEDREHVAAVLERVLQESRSAAGTASSIPVGAPAALSSSATGCSTTTAS